MTKGITIEEAKKQIHEKAIKALTEGLMMIEADAKLKVGVGKYPPSSGRVGGTLKRSITHKVEDKGDKIEGEVGSYGVEYAFYHALQNDYLESSLDENLEQIRRKMGEVLSK